MSRKRIYIVITIITILSFTSGLIVASFTEPLIKVVHMSPIKTEEATVDKIKDPLISDNAVRKLIDLSYTASENEGLIVGAFYYELQDIDKEHGDKQYAKHAKSETLKGFMKDLSNSNLMISYDQISGYVVTPDLQYYLNKYEDKLSKNSFEFYKFRLYEINHDIYNPNLEMPDITEIVKRIDILDKRISDESTDFNDNYKELRENYYDMYSGTTHDFFIDLDTGKFKEAAIKEYEKFADRPDDVGKKARELLKAGPPQAQIIQN